MRFFFRSPQFKKAVSIVAIVLTLAIVAGLIGGSMAPQTGIVGALTAPFQKIGNAVVSSFKELGENFKTAAELNAEKDKLQNEVNSLREQLVDYNQAITENEFYEKYLEIKELNPDFQFTPAMAIGFDVDSGFSDFVIDAGQLQGIALYDPVITDEGLVGYVTEVGAATSKVSTLLNPSVTCGAFDSRTSDAGVVTGTVELAKLGQTRFYNLPRTCSVAVGDLVVTSGSGIFPDGIIIGSINNIGSDPLTSSLYADVTPAVNFDGLKNVMVITSFAGQGNELTDGE